MLKKLDDYKYKDGPMGPIKPRKLLDIGEVSGFLSTPRSKLVSLWKRDSLVEWRAGLNVTPPVYKTIDAIQGNTKNIIRHGGNATRVKRRRK